MAREMLARRRGVSAKSLVVVAGILRLRRPRRRSRWSDGGGGALKILLLALLLAALSGCAIHDINRARSHEWKKDGATPQDLATDRYACMKEAEREGFWIGAGALVASRAAESRRFMACMEARGWR